MTWHEPQKNQEGKSKRHSEISAKSKYSSTLRTPIYPVYIDNLTERIKSYSNYIFRFPKRATQDKIKKIVLYLNRFSNHEEFHDSLLIRGDEQNRIPLGDAGGTWVTNNIDNARTYGNLISYVIPPENPLKMEITDAFMKYVDPSLVDQSEAIEKDWVKLRNSIIKHGYDALEITAPFDDTKDTWIFEYPLLIMNTKMLYDLGKEHK